MQPDQPDPHADDTETIERLVFECLEAADLGLALAQVSREHPELESRVRAAVEALHRQGLLAPSETEGEDRVPERLGPFRMIRKLGEGGMGIVYLAEQEELGRQVALKLIRPEQLYFSGSRERFRREVEAVARLQHAGIVSVFTVGEEEGLPFFTMEYVDGASLSSVLHAHADADPATLTGADLAGVVRPASETPQSGSTTGTRRQIFEQSWIEVCVDIAIRIADALQHAHERGVLHRDVKPSNILITTDGLARLVDFGLARTEGAQQLTRTSTQIGSLPYLPPEQLDEQTNIPSVRQDIYSLGVTLYEMLALRSPFLDSTAEATRRRILEGKPASLRQRNAAVSWDLETVCLTAMDPDPAQRYASISDLLRDLENVRQRRPIEARRPNPWIRLRRWEQRHPTAVAVGGVAVVLIAVAAILFGLFESSARREADRLTKEAERRATEASEVTEFLVDLFKYASPDVSMGEDLPVRMLLQQGAERIERELKGQPEVSARLLNTFGRVYSWLDHTKAADFYQRAADLLQQVHDPADLRVLRNRVQVAAMSITAGRLKEAEAVIADVQKHTRELSPASWLYPRIQRVRARLHGLRGNLQEAERVHREVLASYRRLSTHPSHLAGAMRSLATYLRDMHRYQEAQPLYDECLDLLRSTYPPGHPGIIAPLHAAALNLARLGRYDEARKLVDAAVAEAERIFGATHPAVAGPLNSSAIVHREAGDIASAVAAMQRVLGIAEEYGKHSKNFLARMLNNLAINYHDIGRYQESRKLLERALVASRELFTGDNISTAFLLLNLADSQTELGDHRVAEQSARDGLAMTRRLQPEGPDLPRALNALAWILTQLGSKQQLEEAARHTEEAIRIGSKWPTAKWALGRAHVSRALLANRSGDHKRAEAAARRALELYDAVRRADHPSKAMAWYQLAWAQLGQGNRDAAELDFQRSIDMFGRMDQGYPAKAWPLNHYGFSLLNDRPAEALPLLQEALAIRRRTMPKTARWRLITTLNLAVAHGNLEQFAKAEPLLLEAHAVILQSFGARSREAVASASRLVQLYEKWGRPDSADAYRDLARRRGK